MKTYEVSVPLCGVIREITIKKCVDFKFENLFKLNTSFFFDDLMVKRLVGVRTHSVLTHSHLQAVNLNSPKQAVQTCIEISLIWK